MASIQKLILQKYLLRQCSAGFTLIELIAASIMTIFIVSAAGFGLMVMLREQTITTASGDIKTNLDRAVDFMAEEAKSAGFIYQTASAITTAATNFTLPTGVGAEVVLGLGIDLNNNGNYTDDQPIIYYLRNPTNTSAWRGPKTIYRWGPSFTSSGQYSTGTWGYELLVDSIDSAPSSTINCPSGWSVVFSTSSGFFVCVDSTGKQVEIYAFATAEDDQKIQNIAGANPNENTRYGDRVTYSAKTRVYARSATPTP